MRALSLSAGAAVAAAAGVSLFAATRLAVPAETPPVERVEVQLVTTSAPSTTDAPPTTTVAPATSTVPATEPAPTTATSSVPDGAGEVAPPPLGASSSDPSTPDGDDHGGDRDRDHSGHGRGGDDSDDGSGGGSGRSGGDDDD